MNGAQGLEQGFTFAHRPTAIARTGPLTITLAVTGDLALEQKDGAILLASAKGLGLRYTGLTARDARGCIIPLRLEVRGREIRIVVDDREARYPLVVDPTWSQQQQLTASDGNADDLFGTSVAMSGSTALIGAPGYGGGQGAVYMYVQSSGTWTYQQTLNDPGRTTGDGFGTPVAMSGNTVVIGAPGTYSGQGAAYAFVYSSGS